MRRSILLAAAFAAALAACEKKATVVVPAQPEKKLALAPPAAVTIERGGMTKTDLKLTREALPGELTARFDKLPKGVDVVDSSQKILGDDAAYTFKASDDAALVVNSVGQVTVTGPGGISVTEPIEITVTEKKPAPEPKPAEQKPPAPPPAPDKSSPANMK